MDVTNLPIIVDEHIVGVYGIAKDITEKKHAELALREAELKYRSLVEESIVGVYVIQNERILYANPRLNQLLGYPECTIGLNVWELVHPDDLSHLKANIHKLIEGEEGIHHLFRVIKKDGTVIDVEAHSTRIIYQVEIRKSALAHNCNISWVNSRINSTNSRIS